MKCGEVKGDFVLRYKGGCKEELNIEEAYRCTGCGGRFHRDCIFNHFEIEEGHSIAHNALHNINKITKNKKVLDLCKKGLCRDKQPVKLFY